MTDKEIILYSIASLLRNGESTPMRYGLMAMKLLERLREEDPDNYDKYVKRQTPFSFESEL